MIVLELFFTKKVEAESVKQGEFSESRSKESED